MKAEQDEQLIAGPDEQLIEDAFRIMDKIRDDPVQWTYFRYREKARLDRIARENDARSEGFREGLEKALEEAREKILSGAARTLLRKKMPYDEISDLTGLTLAQINTLASGLPDS